MWTLFPKYKTAEKNGQVWYNCRKCPNHDFVNSKHWTIHNTSKSHLVPGSDGTIEPDGYVVCIDAMSYAETDVEIADFKKYQTGIKHARRRGEILKRTPAVKERQIFGANLAGLLVNTAANRNDLDAEVYQVKELKKEIRDLKAELAVEKAKLEEEKDDCKQIIAKVIKDQKAKRINKINEAISRQNKDVKLWQIKQRAKIGLAKQDEIDKLLKFKE